MATNQNKKWIKPKVITVRGRGKQLARVKFPGGREIPEGGAWSSMRGEQGNYWRRRKGEGACDILDSEPRASKKTTKEGDK